MRREIFANGERYHIYNRGVEKRIIFIDDADYRKFLRCLDYFRKDESGDLIVSLSAYALMPNHFHLLIQQLEEGGISRFLQKVSVAYAMYFNKKYDRWGALFGSRFRAKHVGNDAYFLHLTRYIHRNPIPLLNGKSLEWYPWTSYRHYLGIKRSDLITDDLAMKMLITADRYRRFMGEFAPWEDQLIEGLTLDAE